MEIYEIVSDGKNCYSTQTLLKCIVDEGSFIEYKSHYGKSIVTGFAKI
jgi:acetyl-CoA carboxylase carboxyltransferase component